MSMCSLSARSTLLFVIKVGLGFGWAVWGGTWVLAACPDWNPLDITWGCPAGPVGPDVLFASTVVGSGRGCPWIDWPWIGLPPLRVWIGPGMGCPTLVVVPRFGTSPGDRFLTDLVEYWYATLALSGIFICCWNDAKLDWIYCCDCWNWFPPATTPPIGLFWFIIVCWLPACNKGPDGCCGNTTLVGGCSIGLGGDRLDAGLCCGIDGITMFVVPATGNGCTLGGLTVVVLIPLPLGNWVADLTPLPLYNWLVSPWMSSCLGITCWTGLEIILSCPMTVVPGNTTCCCCCVVVVTVLWTCWVAVAVRWSCSWCGRCTSLLHIIHALRLDWNIVQFATHFLLWYVLDHSFFDFLGHIVNNMLDCIVIGYFPFNWHHHVLYKLALLIVDIVWLIWNILNLTESL